MEKSETSVGDISEPLLRYLYFPMKEYLPLFLDHEYFTEPLKVTPSCFIKEMEFTTQERHKQLLNPLRKCKYGAEPNLAPQSFKPFPEIIIFQKFVPGVSITVALNIMNCCQVLKPLQMSYEKSENFVVTYASKIVITRVAPGMSVAFNVKFYPDDQRDYESSITFNTDNETFIIPIKAIGSRPLFDIPDHIYVPTSPVRVPATKLIVIRNIGETKAVFDIITESPFTVEPKEGILGAQEVMQVIITCMHNEVGEFEKPFVLKYETGEKLYATVHGSAENVNVFFENSEMWFEDTYTGLTRQCSIILYNQSEHLIPYKWKKFSSLSKEEEERKRLKESYKYVQEIEILRSTKVEVFEVADQEAHSVAYERIYEDELKSLETDDFLFNDSVFVIDQLVGEIWPFSSLSMLVTFKPKEAKHYMLQAFCEIGGIENRLELTFNGRGRGPYFQLNLDVLDISYVFLSSKHSYEVIAFNKGHIPGTISFVNQEFIFGGKLSCEPLSHRLEPEECKSFSLTFSSNRRGEFYEDIIFQIKESSEKVKLILQGSVITPTLHFSTKCIQWGDVAVGFPSHRKVELHNLCIVPVAFSIHVSDDGSVPSLTYKKYAAFTKKPCLLDNPQEFNIVPSRGIVPEYSSVTLEITLVANVARKKETDIMVDMWDSKTDSLSLPVSFNAKYASIVCLPENLDIKFCFINCQYNRTITLQNLSKIPGYFIIVPQEDSPLTSPVLTFSAGGSQGVIKSHEKVDIPLTIMTNSIGKQSLDIYLLVMGDKHPVPCCTVTCNGQGPVLSVEPKELMWGETSIVKQTTKELFLLNDSPIPATFQCIIKSGLPWSVDPSCGSVLPAAKCKLTVFLYLRERSLVKGILEIHLENGKSTFVPLSAKGIGLCIEVDPPCIPKIDLNVLYSHCLNKIIFKLTNKGIKHYRIFISHDKSGKVAQSPKDTIFSVHPHTIILDPDECTTVTLEAQYDSVGEVVDKLYLFASDGKSRKIIQDQTTILARFIEPIIKFSKPEIILFANFGVEESEDHLEDELEIFNQEILDLNLQISIAHPFFIKNENALVSKMDIHICGLSSVKVVLCFEPPISQDKYCTITEGALLFNCLGQFTPKSFPVKGEVNYPNVSLIPKQIDLGCIPAGTVFCDHVLLTNVSHLPVNFWWYWLSNSFKVTMLEPVEGCVPPPELLEHEKLVEPCAKDEETASEKIIFSQILNVSEVTLADIEEARKLKEASKIFSAKEDGEKVRDEKVIEEKKIKEDIDNKKEVYLNPIPEIDKLLPTENEKDLTEKPSKDKKSKVKTKQKVTNKKEQKKKKHSPTEDSEKKSESGLETITESESIPTDIEDIVCADDEAKSLSPTYGELKDKLFPLIDKYFEPALDLDIFNILPNVAKKDTDIDEVFEIAPSFGKLNPNSLEYLTISYCGDKCMSAEVTAMCKVEGGPSEKLTVKAMSTNLTYYLDYTNIDFGNQVFCEVCQRTITLYNTGYMEFDFLADAIEPPIASDAGYIFQAGMLIVEPRSGHVNSKSNVQLSVSYVPGISGRFKEEFNLEIGYLLPITINVEGNGVFPQLYVLLPHFQDPLLPVEIGYAAVASLTELQSPIECSSVTKEPSLSSNHNAYPVPDTDLLGLLSEDDWVILMDNECYPAVHEIDLAIERLLAYKHIEENPHELLRYTTIKSFQTIPNFSVPPYVLDFGLVIVDTTVFYTVHLYNYGPVPINVRKVNTNLRKYDLQINFTHLMKFPVDAHSSFQIIFNPKAEHFKTNKEVVKCTFFLEIDHGARIPILIQAVVTLPFLTLSTSLLEFGIVKCGECKSMPLILKNDGLVPCKWQAFLAPLKKSNTKKSTQRTIGGDSIVFVDPAFSIKHEEDIFYPNMVAIVEVFFQPKKSGTSQTNLVLSIDQNPDTFDVIVRGAGIEPCLKIDTVDVNFPPVLPYPEKCEQVFHIENPCPFPVEILFCDFDSEIFEEERILRALSHYYGTINLRLPIRNPGDKLPKELYTFYDNLVTDVNTKLAHQLCMEGLEEEENESKDIEDENVSKNGSSKLPSADTSIHQSSMVITPANVSTISASLPSDLLIHKENRQPSTSKMDVRKSKKKSSLNLSNAESKAIVQSANASLSTTLQDIVRDPDYIEDLIHEYIDELKNLVGFSCENYDPIKDALISTLSPKVSDQEMSTKANILIVFHGAPKTDYVHLAYKAARALNFQPLNIDQIILESAAAGGTLSAMKVRDQINAAYKDYMTKYFPESSEGLDEFPGEGQSPVMDPFEELMKKVKVLETAIQMKKKTETVPTKGKKVGGRASSAVNKASSKRGQQSETQIHNVFSFPAETLIDLINQRFRRTDCEDGIVIDGLRSIFFNSGTLALTSILKAAGNMKYIHFIVLYNTLFDYFSNLVAKQQLEEERIGAESEARIQKLQNVGDNEIDNLNEDDVKLFEHFGIIKRKEVLKRITERLQKLKEEKVASAKDTKLKKGKTSKEKHPGRSPEDSKKKLKEKSTNKSIKSATVPDESSKKLNKKKGAKSAQSNKSENSVKSSKSNKSDKSNKSGKSGKSKESDAIFKNLPISNETRLELQSLFDVFEFEYQEMLTLAESWDQKKGIAMALFHDKVGGSKKGIKGRAKRLDSAMSSTFLSSSRRGSVEDNILPKNLGFPIWIVNCRNSGLSENVEDIIEILKQVSEIEEAHSKSLDWASIIEPESHTYLFANCPQKRETTPHSPYFTLECYKCENSEIEEQIEQTDTPGEGSELQVPSLISSQLSTPSQLGRKGKKRSSSGMIKDLKTKRSSLGSASSVSSKKGKKSSISLDSVPKFKSRWILDPQEKLECKLKFFPTTQGKYSKKYGIEIIGWSNHYIVTANGTADLPSVIENPEIIFNAVSRTKEEGLVYTYTYFLDTDKFDFGAALNSKTAEKRIQPLKTHFTFKNCSELPVEMSCFFEKPSEKVDTFGVDPSTLTINPEYSRNVSVWASPPAVGSFSEILYCCIKNNPVILPIKLTCQGVQCEFIVQPKSIVFDNVLLYQKKKAYLTLTNMTFVPVVWRLLYGPSLTKYFTLSTVDGVLDYKQSELIKIDYVANKVERITKEPLKLEVFGIEGRTESLHTEIIPLSAECFDVMLDILYSEPNETHVNFGVVKMGVENNKFFQLQNKGNHEISYKLELLYHCSQLLMLPVPIQKMIKVEPQSDVIKSGKDCTVKVTFISKCELEIKEVPLINCLLLDAKNSDFIISKIPLNISVASHYSSCVISPSREINFGALPVNSKQTIDLYVENVGTFNFKYTVMKGGADIGDIKLPMPVVSKKSAELKKADRTESKAGGKAGSKSAKSIKEENQTLSLGVFTIYPVTAEVKPSESATVHIDCHVENENKFFEELMVHISESNPADTGSKTLTLRAQCCIPVVDFENIENIFQEQYICQYLNEFESPIQSDCHCAYAKKEGKLMFYRTCVGSYAMTRLKIQNKSLVPCDVTASVGSNTKQTPRLSCTDEVFGVTPFKLSLPPYSVDYFTVTFRPTSIESYTSNLEISTESVKKEKLAVILCGEGNIPQLAITSPEPDPISGCINVTFPYTYVGQDSVRSLKFKNIGFILCKVVLELSMNMDGYFIIYPDENTIPLMKLWLPDKPIQHTTIVSLYPQQTATILIHFQPHEMGCFKTQLKFSIVDNPFENLTAFLYGESFKEDITIDGVDITESETWTQKKGLQPKPPCYQLNYGLCYVNTLKKSCFKITNHSRAYTYRFQWAPHPNILFTPTVGHISPKSSKSIITSFFTSNPLEIKEVDLLCTIVKIKLKDKIPDVTAWDDRQTSVKWGNELILQKENPSEPVIKSRICEYHMLTEINEEPCHEVIPGSLKDISLLVSACADYSQFDCPTEELNFKDTLMFQESIQEIILKNIGIVPLEFKWQLATSESYPVRPSSASLLEVAKVKELPYLSYVNVGTSDTMKNETAETSKSEEIKESSIDAYSQSQVLPSMCSVKSAISSSWAASAKYVSSIELLPHKRILGALPNVNYLYAPKRKKVGRRAYYKTKQASDVGCHVQQSSLEELDLFSKTAELSDRTNDTWLDGDYIPFVVEPEFGTLTAQESITLKIRFLPLDVFVYRVTLVGVIKNMDPLRKPLEITMNARSLMPYCHFDIIESDYLTSGRRNNSLPGPIGMPAGLPLDPETRTLEFNVLGVGVVSTRTFSIINPTDVDYVFQWLDVTSYEDEISSFQCSIMDGALEAGGMIEIKFTFVAQRAGIHESFWKFSIPAENIVMPFLLVGIVTEPSILFQPSHIDFCPTVKGIPTTASVALINNENIVLNYSFVPESLQSSGLAKGLTIKPMYGAIKANSNEIINVKFDPTSPGSFVFAVKCSIKTLSNPLDLFISGSCYKVQPMVSCSDLNTKKWNLNPNAINELDFGSMIPKTTKTIVFNLTNMGKTGFHYGWIYNNDNASGKFKFNVTEKGGFIATQSRVYCKMNLTFLSKSVLKNFEVTLRIPLGPEYRILVQASATMPVFEFSLSEHNFGPCIIQKSERLFNKFNLTFFNKDEQDLALECSFEDKPHLTVSGNFENMVKAKDSIPILIAFRPREEETYEETLYFNIGGSIDKCITIKGEGVPLKLMLVNPEDKCIDFGSLQVDQREMKLVQVINNSKAPVLTLFSTSELFAGTIDATSTNTEVSTTGFKYSNVAVNSDVRIYPTKRIRIAPYQTIKLWVKFYPSKRISPFTEKVFFQVNDHLEPLFVIKGSCFGFEVCLDKAHLTFGAVVQDCKCNLKTTLLNTGDIGSRFRWEYKSIDNIFTITPSAGYCSPGTSAVINVEFHPTSLINHFVYEVFCKLENYDKIILTLSGSCVSLPEPNEVISFGTNVREVEKKVISLQNRSNDTWTILPELKGDYFYGSEIFTILPNEIGQYEVIYSPMTMTAENKHTGSVLFKLPDGQGLLYDLLGIAESPLPNEKKNLEIPTKAAHTEYLTVKNWLQIAQRLKVVTELVKADRSDAPYTLRGTQFITVPGSSERNYKFIIEVYKECNLIFKVMFVNEDGGEYQYYDLFIKVVKCGPIDIINLNTSVRIPVKYELVLENPLGTEVTFDISCVSSEITFQSPCLALPNSMKYINLKYLPLQQGDSICQLDISSTELGSYSYELNLKAGPPPDEKPIHFTANLGSQCTELAHFKNLTKNKAEFICNIDEADFEVNKAVTLQGNSPGTIAVTYEPSSLEGAKGILSLSSTTAGDFVYLLIGTCNKPRPQGPFILKPGGNVTIIFRNPFRETKSFSIHVDSGIFIIKNKSETIKARKDCHVVISLPKSIEFISFPVTGKLVITCTDEMLSEFSWVYYLKGIA